jgi:anti-anti-sigma regulatory factor
MELSSEISIENPQVAVLNVAGRVDGSNYQVLVNKAKQLFDDGAGYLVLNLEACIYFSSAGLFALHNIALMAHKLEPLDQDDGWGALRNMANEKREFKDRFKIVNVPDNIMHSLNIAGLSSSYAIYPARQDALAAFNLIEH